MFLTSPRARAGPGARESPGPVGGPEYGSFKYRDVRKTGKKWRAGIGVVRIMKNLGTFDSEGAAARNLDEAAAPLGRAVNFLLSIERERESRGSSVFFLLSFFRFSVFSSP